MNGQGVPKDYHEALKWSLMAANKGDAEAQCCVGLIYDMALGVPQDYKEAMSWYLKSANQGNAVAENCIGFCYENGHGVPQSYDDAASWFEKSALQGNANAVQNLESMKDLMPSSNSDTQTPGTN
jgi:TPR repeat protein